MAKSKTCGIKKVSMCLKQVCTKFKVSSLRFRMKSVQCEASRSVGRLDYQFTTKAAQKYSIYSIKKGVFRLPRSYLQKKSKHLVHFGMIS